MTPHDLADKIEGLIISASDKYAAAIVRVEAKLYDDLVTILKFVETDQDGYIKQNAGNRQILRAAEKQFDQTINESGFQSAVENHLKVIPKIDALNEAYFESVSSAFKPNRAFISSLQTQAIETVNSYVLQDGLAAQVKIPINQILNQNINTGGQFSGMLKQLRTFIEGNPDLDGRLTSYSRGILKDTILQYSRAYQQSVTADLKLEWYLYAGGIMDKTRPFCEERAGKFFHQSEIEGWAKLSWAGKNNLTTESSIFILCGGHGCIHELIPVSKSIVPKSDLDRISTN
jgi:hypothetical protein